MRSTIAVLCVLMSALASADVIELVEYKQLAIPVTPFSNMASGYQATNPGFRAIIRSESGELIAGGPLTMDSVIKGSVDDASQGTAYGRLVLSVDITEAYPGVSEGLLSGTYRGLLSICMAKDPKSAMLDTQCANLSGNIHEDRPFQWLDKPIDFEVTGGAIRITHFYGYTGDGGSSKQLSLAVFHPAYGFAAPGKAFKDYQSPLVLDLNHNGELDLINVWDDQKSVFFDFNGTGNSVRTGWVDASDGLLFWDNGMGCVTDGTQLFGEYFQSPNGAKFYENGFAALAAKLDGNHTGKIAAAKHKRLKIWRDLNHDGVCEKKEVARASKYVKEIELAFEREEDGMLVEDNEIRLTGHYVAPNGKRYMMADVWMKQRHNVLAVH